jgi:hypothetical protein
MPEAEYDSQAHMLFEVTVGNVFIGTCTTMCRMALIKEAIASGFIKEPHTTEIEFKLIGLINTLHSKVRSSFRPGEPS